MPLTNVPQIWWYPIIYAPLLVSAVVAMRILGYRRGEIGLNFNLLPLQLGVALTGFGLGVAEYFILTEEAMATGLILHETRYWRHSYL